MEYVRAFVVGGAICVIGQLLIDLTKLTPARIMVAYVTGGVILGALGWYAPLVNFAGCGNAGGTGGDSAREHTENAFFFYGGFYTLA